MEESEGFSAIEREDAKILILGSLPGKISIAEQQYYAHAQNAFWPIMNELFGVEGDYARRCDQLVNQRIALWDVLARSVRPTSSDSDLRVGTSMPNDFEAFFCEHKQLNFIGFNGKKAEQLFRRFVKVRSENNIQTVGLPSTSPAYASMRFSDKLRVWRTALKPVNANLLDH